MKNSKYIIESKGFNYADKSLSKKEIEIKKMIDEIAIIHKITVEEVKIKFNIN